MYVYQAHTGCWGPSLCPSGAQSLTKEIRLVIIMKKINEGLLHSGFPSVSNGKESTCSARDLGSISGSERSPGEENSNPLQYSWLEDSVDRGA